MTNIKLGTFQFTKDAEGRSGVLLGENKVIDLAPAYEAYKAAKGDAGIAAMPTCMNAIIAIGQPAFDAARKIVEWVKPSAEYVYALATVKTLNPLKPGKIICIGRSFMSHCEVGHLGVPDEPHIFLKPSTSAVAPEDEVRIPKIWPDKVTYGCELTAVVGKTTKYCSIPEAMDCVAGWTILNDVTCRGMLYPKNKMFDTFAPFGPYIIPADQLPNPQNVPMQFKIDGAWKQEGNTKNMTWTIQYIIANLAQHMTLEPGDIIALGDIGAPETVKDGETMEAIIPEIGILRNKAVLEKD